MSDPAARTEGDRRRHSRQAGLILALFLARPGREVAGSEIYPLARNHTARMSELRRAGWSIRLVRKTPAGETYYVLDGRGDPRDSAAVLASRVRRLVAEFGADAVRSAVAAAVGGDP